MRFPSVRAHTLLVVTPSHSVRAYGHYFLKEIWERGILWITINQMTTKNVIKKLTYRAVSKCQVKNLRRSLGSRMRIFTERGWCKWEILAGCLFVLFLFCMELAGKINAYLRLHLNLSPCANQYAFTWSTHTPLSVGTLWMTPICACC